MPTLTIPSNDSPARLAADIRNMRDRTAVDNTPLGALVRTILTNLVESIEAVA